MLFKISYQIRLKKDSDKPVQRSQLSSCWALHQTIKIATWVIKKRNLFGQCDQLIHQSRQDRAEAYALNEIKYHYNVL